MSGVGQGGERRRTTTVRRTHWPEGSTRPLGVPIPPLVVYCAESPDALDDLYAGRAAGFSYAREGHPNAEHLARRIDVLEGVESGLVVASGMAAVSAAIMGFVSAGNYVLGGNQLYGRSRRMRDARLRRGARSGSAGASCRFRHDGGPLRLLAGGSACTPSELLVDEFIAALGAA